MSNRKTATPLHKHSVATPRKDTSALRQASRPRIENNGGTWPKSRRAGGLRRLCAVALGHILRGGAEARWRSQLGASACGPRCADEGFGGHDT